MEWRLVLRAGLGPLLYNASHPRRPVICRGLAVIPTGRPADPAVQSGELDEGSDAGEAAKAEAAETRRDHKPASGSDPLVPPKPPVSSSPKLENTLNKPINPTTQQKRNNTSSTAKLPSLDDVACVGIDGWASPKGDQGKGLVRQRQKQEDDDKEYFKHRKASPLSEIEVADNRKPVTRATDGTANSGGGRGIILFSEEQKDTVEEALLRASQIWRQNAMRGDPDSPHGRVLRTLRGENW